MLKVFGATDKGVVREVNEDRFAGEAFAADLAYGVVCDGMGGENAGSVASGIACEEIRRMMESSCRPELDERGVYNLLEAAVTTANLLVYETAQKDPENMGGMGTTAITALVSGGNVYLANVGDSRAYLLRNDRLTLLTVDHNVTQMLLDQGELTPQEAAGHEGRHYLTRAVGISRDVAPTYSQIPFGPGDSILLCSDGLYNMIPGEKLPALVGRAVREGDGRCLIEAANHHGGRDNITAVLITWEKG